MCCEDFVKEYMEVRQAMFKATTIRKAFKKSGIWPVNQNVFTDEDYAPSLPTSTTAGHVPASFPTPSTSLESFYVSDEEDTALPSQDRNPQDLDSDCDNEDDDDDDEVEVDGANVVLPISAPVIEDPLGLLPALDTLLSSVPSSEAANLTTAEPEGLVGCHVPCHTPPPAAPLHLRKPSATPPPHSATNPRRMAPPFCGAPQRFPPHVAALRLCSIRTVFHGHHLSVSFSFHLFPSVSLATGTATCI